MDLKNMTKEQINDESLIDLSFAIFEERREPITFQKLMDELRGLMGITKKDMEGRLPQFYTDINTDGRFMAMNDGGWALREWYPVDQIEEETAPVVKTRKKKKKASDDDDEDDLEDLDELDEDEIFEEDYEELGDEKTLDDEEEIDPDEEDVEDPADGLEIVPDEDIDLDEEDEDDEEEEEDEEL